MPCSATNLAGDAACYANVAQDQVQLLKLALLRQILLAANPMADTSTNALLAQVGCYAHLPSGMMHLLELALLKQIVDGGGTGGAGGVLSTTGDPEGVVTSPASPALAVDCNTGALYAYCGVAGANTGWFALIAA